MRKIKLLFDIRDLTVTIFICAGMFFPTSYKYHEESLIKIFGIVMTLSILASLTLNHFCNKYKNKIRKSRNIKKNYITKDMYKKSYLKK